LKVSQISAGVWMRRILIAVLIIGGFGVCGAAETSAKLWFHVGETLHYKMKWGFIPIGSSRIETSELDTGGKKLIVVRYYVQTNRVFDKIYPVKDFMETLIDPDGFVPVTFTKHIERRTPQCFETIVFDRKQGVASWFSQCLNKKGSFDIEPDTRDIISLLYLMRRNRIEEGMSITNKVVVTREITDIVVNVGKKKKMDVAGIDDVFCFKVVPVAKLDDLLVEDGAVEAWVSDDERMIVTKMVIDAPFGKIRTRLCSVTGPGDDRWVKTGEGCGDEEEGDEK